MSILYHKEGDVLLFRLHDDGISDHTEVHSELPDVLLDFNENGDLIAIEILSASQYFDSETLDKLSESTPTE